MGLRFEWHETKAAANLRKHRVNFGKFLKKQTNIQKSDDDMKPRYDFSKGKRTDHARRYAKGHEVRVQRADGSIAIQHFTLEEGTVLLEPDVRSVFKDSHECTSTWRVQTWRHLFARRFITPKFSALAF